MDISCSNCTELLMSDDHIPSFIIGNAWCSQKCREEWEKALLQKADTLLKQVDELLKPTRNKP